MIKAGIIGATGYTGAELIRLLSGHKEVELTAIGARSNDGAVSSLHKSLMGLDAAFCSTDIQNFTDCDIVFLALPHGASSGYAKALVEAGVKVVDLGADFRLNDPQEYDKWYAAEHACKDWMPNIVYGLPEIHRSQIAASKLVANPGCFPTTIILGLAPLAANKLIDPSMVVADSDSGLTGAGKKLTESSHFVNVNGNVVAYKIGNHRHLPEICQEIDALYGGKIDLVFNPHLAPINRGILSTITAHLTKPLTQEEAEALYSDFYAHEPFVRIRKGDYAAVRDVVGSNFCDISVHVVNDHTIVITSAIDNLIKGASGQAIQNMNILFGFDETEGLRSFAVCP
jgi:N-acetyl-gamma-glutamyl-phosphate reductase